MFPHPQISQNLTSKNRKPCRDRDIKITVLEMCLEKNNTWLLSLALKDRPPPIIRQGPSNQTQPLGGVSLLKCQASGDPEPTVTWRKNGGNLLGKDPRFSLLEHGSLQIQSTTVGFCGFQRNGCMQHCTCTFTAKGKWIYIVTLRFCFVFILLLHMKDKIKILSTACWCQLNVIEMDKCSQVAIKRWIGSIDFYKLLNAAI